MSKTPSPPPRRSSPPVAPIVGLYRMAMQSLKGDPSVPEAPIVSLYKMAKRNLRGDPDAPVAPIVDLYRMGKENLKEAIRLLKK